mgnify:CR=1 FL=1
MCFGSRIKTSARNDSQLLCTKGPVTGNSFSALKPWLDKKFPGDSQEVVIPKEKEEDNTEEKKVYKEPK